jgi:hypothetical protein
MDASRRIREISEQFVQSGAVMAVAGSPATYDLVGSLRWIDDKRLMWFVAHGDAEADAHAMDFDHVQVVDNLGLCFMRAGRVEAYLSPIEAAQVDDPEDYRIGWQIWREVAPLYDAMIERAFDHLEHQTAIPRPPHRDRNRHAAVVAA